MTTFPVRCRTVVLESLGFFDATADLALCLVADLAIPHLAKAEVFSSLPLQAGGALEFGVGENHAGRVRHGVRSCSHKGSYVGGRGLKGNPELDQLFLDVLDSLAPGITQKRPEVLGPLEPVSRVDFGAHWPPLRVALTV